MSNDRELEETTPEDFEELVAAALKVDPKGIAGKHRKTEGAEQVHTDESSC